MSWPRHNSPEVWHRPCSPVEPIEPDFQVGQAKEAAVGTGTAAAKNTVTSDPCDDFLDSLLSPANLLSPRCGKEEGSELPPPTTTTRTTRRGRQGLADNRTRSDPHEHWRALHGICREMPHTSVRECSERTMASAPALDARRGPAHEGLGRGAAVDHISGYFHLTGKKISLIVPPVVRACRTTLLACERWSQAVSMLTDD